MIEFTKKVEAIIVKVVNDDSGSVHYLGELLKDNGGYMYWPGGNIVNYFSKELRQIADKLDELNE